MGANKSKLPNNPCACVECSPNSDGTTHCSPKSDCTCLGLCSMLIEAKDAVGPCAQEKTVDLNTAATHDTCVCGDNPVKWSLVDRDDVFISVDVKQNGILTYKTGDIATSGTYSKLCVKAQCDCFASYTDITIGVKDECKTVLCDDCDTCNPCNGECVDNNVDLSLNSFGGSGELNIQ